MLPEPARLADHTYLFVPGTDPAAPPLLLLHGTGGSEQDLVPLAQKLSPGSALLSPRGNVSEAGAARFFRRFAEGVFDLTDVRTRTLALADFIAAAAQQHGIATSRLLAIGFSNGANVAATLMQLRPESVGGGLLLRPMVVLDEPAAQKSLTGRRVLIASGDSDPLVTEDHPPRLAALLRRGGANVTLHRSHAGHGLTPSDFEACHIYLKNLKNSSG